jgi:hypothetical protein
MAADLGETKNAAGGGLAVGSLRTPAHGHGKLKHGNPAATGRPRQELRDWARTVLSDPAVQGAVRDILTDPANRQFAAMWKALAERAFGPVVQRVKLHGKHEVRGVILLPQQSWGAPAAAAAPSPSVPPSVVPGPALDTAAATPAALPAAAVPLSPALLASVAAEVVAAMAAASAGDGSTDDTDAP